MISRQRVVIAAISAALASVLLECDRIRRYRTFINNLNMVRATVIEPVTLR